MADEFDFDPSKKKKKKKKTTLEGLDDETETDPKPEAAAKEEAQVVPEAKPKASKAAEAAPAAAAAPAVDDLDDDLDLLTSKKKKKKKKTFEPLDDELPSLGGEGASAAAGSGSAAAATATEAGEDADGGDGVTFDASAPARTGNDDDIAFDSEIALPDKKKKKKKKAKALDDLDLDDDVVPQQEAASSSGAGGAASSDADREYTYLELLDRLFNIMRQKNPDMVAGERRQMVIKPPQVHRLGTRRTAFANFTDYALKMLRRPPEHLQNFLVAELGASGSVDGSAALVIRGRFQQKQIESVLRKYIREYVTCHTCKSSETTMEKEKESRLSFLKCESCGSRAAVASIRAGFQAVTGKRAAMRAKEG